MGSRVIHFDVIDSTNAEAPRLAARGETGPLWIVAERQTAGRGRSGRTWVSEPGNLHATLLWRLSCDAQTAAQLSLLAGVAVMDAISAAGSLSPCGGGLGRGGTTTAVGVTPLPNPSPQGGGELRLKWPNDILIGTAKAGGILVETTRGSDGALFAAIGIGLNLASHPALGEKAITSLRAHGLAIEAAAMLDTLDASFAAWGAAWDEGRGFLPIRQAWMERAGPIGERVTVEGTGRRIEGRYAGLDHDGALLLRDKTGHIQRVTFGDVTLTARGAGVMSDAG